MSIKVLGTQSELTKGTGGKILSASLLAGISLALSSCSFQKSNQTASPINLKRPGFIILPTQVSPGLGSVDMIAGIGNTTLGNDTQDAVQYPALYRGSRTFAHLIMMPKGGSLLGVARFYGITLDMLLRANPSLAKDPDHVVEGALINIPPITPGN